MMFGNATIYTRKVPVRSFPMVKCARIAKFCMALTPFVTMFIGLLMVIIILSNDHEPTTRVPRGRKISKKSSSVPRESLAEYVERIGICDAVPPEEISIRNITLRSNETFAVNATVRDICKNITSLRAAYFRPRDTKENPFVHHYLISANKTCHKETDIIVLVHSFHTYYDRRESIRQTWGGAVKENYWPTHSNFDARIKLLFVLGLHANDSYNENMKQESAKYGDIIQGDFIDHYHNMTLKSLFGLKWVSEFCSSAKYLVKSDDDMIINFPYLIEVLNQTNMTGAIMGPFNSASKVYRKGKWKLDRNLYPLNFYPPYESGSAYVISTDLVKPLFQIAEYVPPIFIDDVYITGILGKILHVRHIDHKGFAFWTDKKPKLCDIARNKILTGTKMKPFDLVKFWEGLSKRPHCNNYSNEN